MSSTDNPFSTETAPDSEAFLCRLRRRTRATLRACQPGGGYCPGTGNRVANYDPLDNYLAMLDEGRRFG